MKHTVLSKSPYASYNLSQLPAFITDALVGKRLSPLWELYGGNIPTNVNKVLFILIDGFGNKQWLETALNSSSLSVFNKLGAYNKIHTTFPSSTPVALTTLYSGGTLPSQHALTDWWMYDRNLDEVIVTLPFSTMADPRMDSLKERGASPQLLYSGVTFYEKLKQLNIDSSIFIKDAYHKSAYTSVTQRGGRIYPFSQTSKDMFGSLKEVLGGVDKKHLLYAYWGDIDEIGHKAGPSSAMYQAAVSDFARDFGTFVNSLDSDYCDDTLCIITSDHGQIDVAPQDTVYLDSILGFDDLLRISPQGKPILPWGGAREVFVAVKDGMIEDARKLLSEALKDKADIILSKDAFDGGLFGLSNELHPDFLSRIGDILILPRNNLTVWYHHPYGKPVTTLGQHGGLSESELEVPFAAAMLGDIKRCLEGQR